MTILTVVLFSGLGMAQEKWGLERCIREALDKSLLIQQFELNQQGYEINGRQLRYEHLPSLNANTNLGWTFGRVINPSTNDFETDNSYYQSLGVGANLNLFSGFRIRNSIRQNNINLEASQEDVQQAKEDLELNVALAYLNVLFAYENADIAQDRVDLSKQQLDNLDKLIAAGSRPENDRYDLLAQVATDDQNLITAQNNIEINLLSLKQQMWMEPNYPLEIERPTLSLEGVEPLENEPFDTVYHAALETQPQIHAAELREKANEEGIGIARSQMIPSLALGANFGTTWSDLDKQANSFALLRVPQPGVYINGEAADVEVESLIPTTYSTVPYIDQLNNNIGYGLDMTLVVPIFNNNIVRANVEKAKINVLNSNIETNKLKQTLKTNIQNALSSAKAARKSLEAAEASSLAAKIALENATRKSELGTINNYDYLSARNRSDSAENSLLIARYDYYFKVKVIEYYLGRGMQLD
jgi:outer membrane protein